MQRTRGFTLVELMIALVLGLVIIGGVINIFLANREAYRTQQNLARIMDNARVAFELMAREVREAGANACGTSLIVNVLNNPGSNWWSNWAAGGLVGYGPTQTGAPVAFGTGQGQRVSGTEAVEIRSATGDSALTITEHNPTSAQFKVRSTNHGIQDGDIMMACDDQSAAIFQVTNAQSTNVTIVHNTGTGTPGNCSKGLGYANPVDCSTNGTPKTFKDGGFLVKLHGSFWYIGNNGRGGRSLYRMSMSGNTTTQVQEIAEGVTNMELRYLPFQGTDYVAAGSITNWPQVMAVRITLTLAGTERVGIGGTTTLQTQTLQRQITHVVQLRNQTEL